MPWMPLLLGSGCGAAWLARLLGVQEVPSSNLGSPTIFFNNLAIYMTTGLVSNSVKAGWISAQLTLPIRRAVSSLIDCLRRRSLRSGHVGSGGTVGAEFS